MGCRSRSLRTAEHQASNLIAYPPTTTVRVAINFGSPIIAPHDVGSTTQRASGSPPANTVAAPLTTTEGAGKGGCAGPADVNPVQTTEHIAVAAGKNSIITVLGRPPTGGATTPVYVNPSC